LSTSSPFTGTAVIIGAGPAGLTAAYELLQRTTIKPIVLESSTYMGGISRTVNYKGNRIDIGGHRFFSKSDRVMNWWLNIMPLQRLGGDAEPIRYQGRTTSVGTSTAGPDPDREDRVMLLRPRKSRIYFNRRFFDYPISLSPDTLLKLGPLRSARIGLSFLRSRIFPIRPEENLEQFFINRFGRELYATFFKSYTEKVWGVPCNEISAEWGAQRVQGVNLGSAILHFVKRLFGRSKDIAQKSTETSLIEQFLYPKYGPGQMWDEVAHDIRARGGEILTGHRVMRILTDGETRVRGVIAARQPDGAEVEIAADHVFSTMPIRHLVRGLDTAVPPEVTEVAEGLVYRDFITVGLLVDRLKVTEADGSRLRDNWIYIQEPDVLVGRMQIFNNWSPYLVADPNTTWIGMEYFCYSTDPMWSFSDEHFANLAADELARIGLADRNAVRDATVIRMPKTYPAYFGSYDRFDVIRSFTDRFENLYLIGRNGMHRYNNQDHSMLTAMLCVDNIVAGRKDKSNLWEVNTEGDYHEEK
jgi:protoporphyrinogen oxidase